VRDCGGVLELPGDDFAELNGLLNP